MVIERDSIQSDLIFIYDEIENYINNDFVVDPDLSKDIELENVKNRLAIDYQKRKLNKKTQIPQRSNIATDL